MPVKVKIQQQRQKLAPVAFGIADFACPGQTRARRIGLGVGLGVMVVVLALLYPVPSGTILMAVWVLWILLAVGSYLSIGDRNDLRRLGLDDKRATAAPDTVADMVGKQARAVGVVARVAVSPQAEAPMTVRNTVVLPESLLGRLSPAETWATIAREVGFIKAGDVNLRNLLRRLDQQSGALHTVLGLPLRPLAHALWQWRWYAEISADHMALILTRDRKVLAAALLKQAAAGADVSAAEIDEYLSRPGDIAAQSDEVTTHFKLGEVLRERQDLMARLRAVSQYADSPEYRAACEKLDTANRKPLQADAGGPPAPGSTPPTAGAA